MGTTLVGIWTEYGSMSVMETLGLCEAMRGATGDKLREIYIYWLYQTIRRTQFVTGIETKQGVRVRVGTWSIFNLSVSMFLQCRQTTIF